MLGGRSEVVGTPAVELFKYMEMTIEEVENKKKEKQAEMYISYLSNIFSQQPQEKPSNEYLRAKKEFESLLAPDNGEVKSSSKSYEWDSDVQDLIEASR